MIGGHGNQGAVRRLGAGLGALVLLVAGCSGSDAAPESDRPCAVVQADEVSDIVGTQVTLEDPVEGSRECRFSDDEGTIQVFLTVDSPVETGLPELLLTDPEPIEDLGDAAYSATDDVPLDVRVIARVGGSMLTVDVGAPTQTRRARLALATEVAEAGLPQLPEADPAEPEGERGDEACARYETDEVAALLGGVPTVEAVAPPGSCALSLGSADLEVQVTVLLESGATVAQLESLVAAVDTDVETTVGEAPARWVPSPAERTGGQLDVLDGDRILQVAVLADGLANADAQDLATALAAVAIAER
ncbi:MAG: hypothetical protein KDA98_08895 [Acidimicrobiales bacterium]|nr:hypothetical protein [Acidimicrobiales bacterium]